MRLRFGPLVKNWATVYGNCFPKGLVRNFLVMMTSSMTSITVSNPHNPVMKTDVFRKTQVRPVVAAISRLRVAAASRSCSGPVVISASGWGWSTGLTVHRTDKTGKYLAAHHRILGCSRHNTWLHQCSHDIPCRGRVFEMWPTSNVSPATP